VGLYLHVQQVPQACLPLTWTIPTCSQHILFLDLAVEKSAVAREGVVARRSGAAEVLVTVVEVEAVPWLAVEVVTVVVVDALSAGAEILQT
jgi:hypothetical protein